MEIDPEVVVALAKKIDKDDHQGLAELFSIMLQEEHSARHKARPALSVKFTEMIDDERRKS